MFEKDVLNSIYEMTSPKMEIKVNIGWYDYIFNDPLKASTFMITAKKYIVDDVNITMEAYFIEEEDNEDEE